MKWGKGWPLPKAKVPPTTWPLRRALVPHRCQCCGKWFWMERGHKKVQVGFYEPAGAFTYDVQSYTKVTWRCLVCGPAA